jgi:phosphoglucomutase
VDLSKEGSYTFGGFFRVEVFDCVEDHLGLLKQVFDFGAIQRLFARKDFSFCYDSMNGVQGPYAKRIFVQEFGAPASALINCDPKEDFGGEHAPAWIP